MHLRRATFHRLTVVLHLVERGRVAVAVDHFFTLLVCRAGDDHFVGVDFDAALGHDDVTGEGHDVALHIQRLLIGFNMNRLIGIAG